MSADAEPQVRSSAWIAELEAALNHITGVVTNGLFARRGADVLLLGTPSGVEIINKNK